MWKIFFLSTTYLLAADVCFCLAIEDPLPSWNEGTTKHAIIQFIQNTTTKQKKNYISPDARIATFDQDGTLWPEKPMYTQLAFTISQIKKLEANHPEWKNQQPYQTILEGNLEKILEASHAGMTVSQFQTDVKTWMNTAKHPRFKKRYTDLAYQPMLELIQYLKSHKYKVYIVSGGGQDFIRAYSDQMYGIPPEQVIGSAGKTLYEYKNGQPILIKLPEVLLVDDKSGKPEAIHLFIGKHPTFSVGNSNGDKEMLEWSQASHKSSLQLLVHHDNPILEYAYDTDSKIGTFSEALKEQAIKNNWIIISIKNDWKKIFSFQ